MQFQIGQEVRWHKIVSNYGHIYVIPATVRKIGKRRITIEVSLNRGGTRKTSVRPENLKPVNG